MTATNTDIVSPFDWQRYTAARAEEVRAERPRRKTASRAKNLTVRERIERMMAPRWGNPYCRPGAA